MFLVKKWVTPFLLPPGLFVLFLVVAGLWCFRRRSWTGTWVSLMMGGLIWGLSVPPTVDLLVGGLEQEATLPKEIRADVIVMLGGAAYQNVADLSGRGAPGPGTMERMVTAARLYRRLQVPIIVSGGRVFSEADSVALLTKRFLVDLGVPAAHILLEDRSRDTYENALYSKQICERHGFQRPLVVTSGYHLKRARLSFEKVGLEVTPFPCAMTTYPGKVYNWHHWLPSATALAGTSAALHEWLGLIYYRLRY